MKSRYSVLLKDTVIFGLGSFGSKAILFLMVPIYTNVLHEDEYGTAELIFTIAQLLAPFLSVVIFDAIIRFGLSKYEKKENVILVGVMVFFFASIIGLLITPAIGLYDTVEQWKWYLYIYVVLNIANSIEMSYLKAKDKNKAYAILSVCLTGLMAGLNVFFLVFENLGIQGYLLAYIIANLIIDVSAYFIGNIGKDLRKARFDKRLFKEMIFYSSPLILNNVSWWVIHSADKVMVEVMVSTVALGIYTVSAKIPSLINVFVSVFQQAWGISAVKEIETSNDNSYYSNVLKYFFLFTSGVCIVLVGIIKVFMGIYVGVDFIDSWRYVPLLLVSAVFASVASYYGSLYSALKKSINNMATTALAAVINIVLNYIFIPLFGIWGAVVGTVCSYIVIALARILDVGRFINLEIPWLKFSCISMIIILQAILVSADFHIAIVSILALIMFIVINYADLLYIGKTILINNIKKNSR